MRGAGRSAGAVRRPVSIGFTRLRPSSTR
jgi:hypothetical protein